VVAVEVALVELVEPFLDQIIMVVMEVVVLQSASLDHQLITLEVAAVALMVAAQEVLQVPAVAAVVEIIMELQI
jgi:hypothetical protein